MILITGATSLMGCALIRELYNQGVRDLRVLIHRSNNLGKLLQDVPFSGLKIECVHGSTTDLTCLQKALCGVSHVYHLDSFVSIVPSAIEYLKAVNETGIVNLMNVAVASGVQKVVYLSSVEALGFMPGETILSEKMGFRPDHTFMDYGKSKALGALKALEIAQQTGLSLVILIAGGIIGPYDYSLSPLGKMVLNITRGKTPAYVNGSLHLVDNRDLAILCLTAMKSAPAYESYLCSGTPICMEQFIRMTAHLTKQKMPPKINNTAAHILASFCEWYHRTTGKPPLVTQAVLRLLQAELHYDNSKACRELNWQSRPIEETIADTVTWLNIFFPNTKW